MSSQLINAAGHARILITPDYFALISRMDCVYSLSKQITHFSIKRKRRSQNPSYYKYQSFGKKPPGSGAAILEQLFSTTVIANKGTAS